MADLPLVLAGEYARVTTGYGVLPLLYCGEPPLNFAMTGSGGATVSGGASLAFGSSVTASGGVKVSGAATVSAVSGAPLAMTGSGGALVGGAALVSEVHVAIYEIVASGGVVVSGAAQSATSRAASLSVTLKPVRCALTGKHYATASINAALPPPNATLSGLTARSGVLSATAPRVVGALTGGVYRLAATTPRLIARLSAQSASPATIDARLARVSCSMTGYAARMAMTAVRIPRVRASLGGLSGTVALLQARIPVLIPSVQGASGTIARVTVTISMPGATIRGVARVSGSIAVGLPRVRAEFDVRLAAAQVLTQVTNLVTNAVTLYEHYPFNSFAEFGGKFLAAGPDGVYQIDVGDRDAGAPISARFKTGESDFGSEFVKSVPYLYCALRATDDLVVRVCVDERTPIEYILSPLDVETLRQRRVDVGKGARGKYWSIEVENTAGGDFDIDTMNIAVNPARSRI